jgi:hypothetical protein
METIKGTLSLHSETGTEGGYWAIQDERFITPPVEGSDWPYPHWSYDGLKYLEDGDSLKIFNPDGTIYWEGTISLKQHPVFTESVGIHDESTGVNLGIWIHADQNGIDRHTWALPFMKNYKGELTKHGK